MNIPHEHTLVRYLSGQAKIEAKNPISVNCKRISMVGPNLDYPGATGTSGFFRTVPEAKSKIIYSRHPDTPLMFSLSASCATGENLIETIMQNNVNRTMVKYAHVSHGEHSGL
jgi:hypothetical protein